MNSKKPVRAKREVWVLCYPGGNPVPTSFGQVLAYETKPGGPMNMVRYVPAPRSASGGRSRWLTLQTGCTTACSCSCPMCQEPTGTSAGEIVLEPRDGMPVGAGTVAALRTELATLKEKLAKAEAARVLQAEWYGPKYDSKERIERADAAEKRAKEAEAERDQARGERDRHLGDILERDQNAARAINMRDALIRELRDRLAEVCQADNPAVYKPIDLLALLSKASEVIGE